LPRFAQKVDKELPFDLFPHTAKPLNPPNITIDFFPQTTLSQIPQFTSARFIPTNQFMRFPKPFQINENHPQASLP
jgi:hypothetical protein